MRKANIIYLRAHHLLCLQGYQGYGYDEGFKAKMEDIIDQLANNNNEEYKLIITDSADDLCKSCPNLIDGKCLGDLDSSDLRDENKTKINKNKTKINQNKTKINENNSKIINMDNIVLEKAKIEKNQEYSFNKLISIINKSFPTIKDAKKVCKNCKWIKECLWIQSLKTS